MNRKIVSLENSLRSLEDLEKSVCTTKIDDAETVAQKL